MGERMWNSRRPRGVSWRADRWSQVGVTYVWLHDAMWEFPPPRKIGGNDPIWHEHIFRLDWFNHQLVMSVVNSSGQAGCSQRFSGSQKGSNPFFINQVSESSQVPRSFLGVWIDNFRVKTHGPCIMNIFYPTKPPGSIQLGEGWARANSTRFQMLRS